MSFDSLGTLLNSDVWWSYLLRIGMFYFVAWVVHRVSNTRFGRVRALWQRGVAGKRADRQETTSRLISSFITVLAFVVASLLTLSLFLPADTLIWMVGLFAGGFGIALMPILRDIFTGITFLFEDAFDVGEKVELLTATSIHGVVEHVNLRTTHIRARSGELYSVPNGEIRVVRNFSRGHFSVADVVISLDSADLSQALETLTRIGSDAMLHIPELIEPMQVISETGRIGNRVELKLVAKARYGQAAEVRPRLLAYIQKQLSQAEVDLIE